MKSIPNQAKQITPFGGPRDPIRAWQDQTFFHVRNPGTYRAAPKLAAATARDQESIAPGEKDLIDSIIKATLDRLHRQFPPGTRPVLRNAHFEFAVQLQTDPAKMPVEDPVVIWDEALSPFQRVAIIRIPKQDIDAKGRVELAENLAFTPWHFLPEHRPLGSMNRA